MIYNIASRTLLAVLLSFILLVCTVHAQTITGKVVGVSDGDTITMLQDRTQYKIRLYDIDCPEKGQDFGNRAKKFVSGMVYGKQLKVIQKDMDRYGRVSAVWRLKGPDSLYEHKFKSEFYKPAIYLPDHAGDKASLKGRL